jgi:hypothetical protein
MTAPYNLGQVVDLGDLVTLTFTTSVAGILTDATSVSLLVQDPSAATTTYTPVRDSVGTYHYDYTPTVAGTYLYRWLATGAAQDAQDGSFLVQPALSLTAAFEPSPGQVHALIAQRPAFSSTSKPSLTEVQYLIDQRTADVLGEIDGSNVPPRLFGLAQRTIALGVAADIESGYFPEQQLGDSQHASLTARYLQALTRFQQLLAAEGGGPVRSGTMRAKSATLQAATETAQAAGLGAVSVFYDDWCTGY